MRRVRYQAMREIPLGPTLKELREVGGLNQEQFGELVGLRRQKVSEYERGSRVPGVGTLWRISKGTSIPLWKIIRKAEMKLNGVQAAEISV